MSRPVITIDELRSGELEVVASVSGGKDSTAMCLNLRELDIPYRAVHQETGWENAETDRYLREELPKAIGPVEFIRAEFTLDPELEAVAATFEAEMGVSYSAMVRLIIRRGTFPSRVRRFCTQELKVFPMRDYLAKLDADAVHCVGIRANESMARSKMPEWEYNKTFDCDVWRPLIDWTVDDVIAIHQRHGVAPNRNYFEGAERVGCWPCIFARKSELRDLGARDPGRVDLLERLEAVVAELAAKRYAERGETFESLGYHKPTWFQERNPKWVDAGPCEECDGIATPDGWEGECEACGGTGRRRKRDGTPMPIRNVIEWANTARGGRQYELFTAPPRDAGCVRWGMCDVATGDD